MPDRTITLRAERENGKWSVIAVSGNDAGDHFLGSGRVGSGIIFPVRELEIFAATQVDDDE
jgi:hypothetical protein